MRAEGRVLDKEQIASIVNEHRNNLVIAPAGSGKTTTIVGKVKYLIKTCNVNYDEILCLSFTNKSAAELRERIKKELDMEIGVFTFHKLGINIIANTSLDKKEYVTDTSVPVINILNELLNDPSFLDKFLRYFYDPKRLAKSKEIFNKEYFKIIAHAKYLADYINLIKQEKYEIEELDQRNRDREYLRFIEVITPVYLAYQKYLTINNLIDFNDMINYATKLIRESSVKVPYKHIIVDEYQDISLSRFELINVIYQINQATIFCVGDDYQCIFSYAGSKLDLFVNFENYYGEYNLNMITKTYRFNQMLANISNEFITKNKQQFKKQVNSMNDSAIQSLKIIPWDDLAVELSRLPSYASIYFLGRYGHDLMGIENNHLFNIEYFQDEISIYFKRRADLKIGFMTVHQSKGLEADYIFILNNKQGRSGFPSEKEDSKIRKILFPRKDFFEEERRLYYVAMTRAKKCTILLTKEDNQSSFLLEVQKILKKQ